MKQQRNVLSKINTFGAVTPDDENFLTHRACITLQDLSHLIDSCLSLGHLLPPILQSLQPQTHNIKLNDVLCVIKNDDIYRFMMGNLPTCIINNRMTQSNLQVIIASLLVFSLNKLNIEQIKETVHIFSLEERQNETEGIFKQPQVIMPLLKYVNKTVSLQWLRHWVNKCGFQRENFVMAHEFIYLVSQCRNRDVYLRRIEKAQQKQTSELLQQQNKNTQNTPDRLFLIPKKDLMATPDFRIQQLLNQQSELTDFKSIKRLKSQKNITVSSKKSRPVSRLKQLLKNQEMFRDIKECLVGGKRKTEEIEECLLEMTVRRKRGMGIVGRRSYREDMSRTFVTSMGVSPRNLNHNIPLHLNLNLLNLTQTTKPPIFRQAPKRPTTPIIRPSPTNKLFQRVYQQELMNNSFNKTRTYKLAETFQ